MAAGYRSDRFELHCGQRRLLVDGEPAVLGGRAFDLLLCLIERRDRLVSKDELIAQVWQGRVVQENNLTVQVSAVRKLLGSDSVTTVAGRGYRFALRVSAFEDSPADAPAPGTTPAAAGADAVALSLPAKPSIAVLPFANLSGDAGEEYFCDGISEEIITELARFHWLFVIARNSTFTYKGRAVDVRTVARELGVRYVVEGSIRRAGNRVRVTAQLIDALTGSHIWAEKFDRVREDIFCVQEEVTSSIVAAVGPQVESAEGAKTRRARPANFSAYELSMRSWDLARSALGEWTGQAIDQALRLAREALALDRDSVLALRMVAHCHWLRVFIGGCPVTPEAMQEAFAAANHAVSVDGGDHTARLYKGMLLALAGRTEEALADMRLARELNPNGSLALATLGHAEAMAGDPQTGIRHITEALRLNPRDPNRFLVFNCLAWSYFAGGEDAKALAAAERSAADRPGFMAARLCLAVTCAAVGDLERARSEFEFVRCAWPVATQLRLDGRWSSISPGFQQRATRCLRIAAGIDSPRDAARPATAGPRKSTAAARPPRKRANLAAPRRAGFSRPPPR